jgi:uncharacterized protein (TIGR02757 family)
MILPLPRRPRTIQGLKAGSLKAELDRICGENEKPEFVLNDPVQFPRLFKAQKDIEIAAFLSAAIAWGNRDMIIRSCKRMFSLLNPSPFAFVMNGNYARLKDKCIHRTFFESDLKYFCRGFKNCYTKYDSLESLFALTDNVWDGMALFREIMAQGNKGASSKHIADSASNSACKRLNLCLRWLVRNGPVDMGLWKKLPSASLYIPLDIHVGRIARSLGLLDPARKSNDKKAVFALTEKLREFCPEDPVKYDFALFSMGIGIIHGMRAK